MKVATKPRIEHIDIQRVENGFRVSYWDHTDDRWTSSKSKHREYVFPEVFSLNTWLKDNFA